MKTLIILVGIPGSGKSTLAAKMCKDNPHSYYFYVNQDMFKGNREQTWNCFKQYMDQGQNVILDRCNVNRKQRSPFINYAKQMNYRIEVVHLHVDTQTAIDRIMSRKGHATIPETTSLDKVTEIVQSFNKSFEPPSMYEGVDSINAWRNNDRGRSS